MARGRKPQDPEHGAMTPNERSARRRAILAEQAQAAIERPSEAHNLPGPALVAALQGQLAQIERDPVQYVAKDQNDTLPLQGQLAQIERDPVASRHQAAAVVAALVRKYRLPLFVSLEAPIDTRLDAGGTV